MSMYSTGEKESGLLILHSSQAFFSTWKIYLLKKNLGIVDVLYSVCKCVCL